MTEGLLFKQRSKDGPGSLGDRVLWRRPVGGTRHSQVLLPTFPRAAPPEGVVSNAVGELKAGR